MSCCSGSFASKQSLSPNVSTLEVTEAILWQAALNHDERIEQVKRGHLSPQELSAADERLITWLAATFSDHNPHFRCESEWNGKPLVAFLREQLADQLEKTVKIPIAWEQPETALYFVFGYWLDQLYELIKTRPAGMRVQEDARVRGLIDQWTLWLIGAPSAGEFRGH